MIGLLNAAQNFAPTKGANFETYAGIRIRGAMLDEARRSNWTPRSTFRNAKQVSLAIRVDREPHGPRRQGAGDRRRRSASASRSTTAWSRARPRAAS